MNNAKTWMWCEHYFWENWKEIFNPKKFNWVGFHFFIFHVEYDPHGPIFSLNFGILGLGFYLSANPPWETRHSKELKKTMDDIKEHPENLKTSDEDDFRPNSELGDIG